MRLHGTARIGLMTGAALAALALAGCVPPSDATGSSEPAAASTAAASVPVDVPASSTPASAPAAASPEETVRAAVVAALGDLNRDGQRVASVVYDQPSGDTVVTYAVNDNLSAGLLRTAAWHDSADIIQALRSTGLPLGQLITVGTMAFETEDGSPLGERPIATITFAGDVVTSAEVDGLPAESLEALASDVEYAPALRD
jgi:hypothetical protein